MNEKVCHPYVVEHRTTLGALDILNATRNESVLDGCSQTLVHRDPIVGSALAGHYVSWPFLGFDSFESTE